MFHNRIDGARQLAKRLAKYKNRKDVIVLAIPRGGVVIGRVVADALNVPLDIIITKKIGFPGNPEYAVGAVGPKGDVFLTGERVPEDYLEAEKKRLAKIVDARYRKFRGARPLPVLKGKVVILVDDGLATGSTMIAAAKFVEKESPKKVVVAVPVAAADTLAFLKKYVDDVVCVLSADVFFAIGGFYDEFPQVEDSEVVKLLEVKK